MTTAEWQHSEGFRAKCSPDGAIRVNEIYDSPTPRLNHWPKFFFREKKGVVWVHAHLGFFSVLNNHRSARPLLGCQLPTLDTDYRSRVGGSALNPSLQHDIFFYYDKKHNLIPIFFILFPFYSKPACTKALIRMFSVWFFRWLFDDYSPAGMKGFNDRCLDVNVEGWWPSKHETLIKCWRDTGPASKKMGQHFS